MLPRSNRIFREFAWLSLQVATTAWSGSAWSFLVCITKLSIVHPIDSFGEWHVQHHFPKRQSASVLRSKHVEQTFENYTYAREFFENLSLSNFVSWRMEPLQTLLRWAHCVTTRAMASEIPKATDRSVFSSNLACQTEKYTHFINLARWGLEWLFFGTFVFSCVRGENSRGLGPNSRGLGPNSRGLGLNSRGLVPQFPRFTCRF